jgi:DNA mismatch repair ATPase MutL
MALLSAHKEQMSLVGIDYHEVGKEAIAVTALPPNLSSDQVRTCLLDLLEEGGDTLRERRRLVARICRHLVSSSYTQPQAALLLNQLLKCADPHHCPQGKSTLFYFKEGQLEQAFTTTSGKIRC